MVYLTVFLSSSLFTCIRFNYSIKTKSTSWRSISIGRAVKLSRWGEGGLVSLVWWLSLDSSRVSSAQEGEEREKAGRRGGNSFIRQVRYPHTLSHTVITFLSRISLINYCSSPVSSHGSNWLLFLISSRVLALPSYLCRTFDRQSGLANMIFK